MEIDNDTLDKIEANAFNTDRGDYVICVDDVKRIIKEIKEGWMMGKKKYKYHNSEHCNGRCVGSRCLCCHILGRDKDLYGNPLKDNKGNKINL